MPSATPAASNSVIKVGEDKSPVRYYFPRADIRMEKLERSKTSTECLSKKKESRTRSFLHLRATGGPLSEGARRMYRKRDTVGT